MTDESQDRADERPTGRHPPGHEPMVDAREAPRPSATPTAESPLRSRRIPPNPPGCPPATSLGSRERHPESDAGDRRLRAGRPPPAPTAAPANRPCPAAARPGSRTYGRPGRSDRRRVPALVDPTQWTYSYGAGELGTAARQSGRRTVRGACLAVVAVLVLVLASGRCRRRDQLGRALERQHRDFQHAARSRATAKATGSATTATASATANGSGSSSGSRHQHQAPAKIVSKVDSRPSSTSTRRSTTGAARRSRRHRHDHHVVG